MALQGNITDYLLVFSGGVLVSFSPCVYPLIPVTLSFIGARAGGSKLKGLFLSLVFVLGFAVTYSILGLIASLTGSLFGKISTHPLTYFILGNVFILSGLSFLEVININFIGLSAQGKIKNTGGFLAAFLLGLFAGLGAGPCVAPALGAVLVYVASKANVVYGASLLFTFAYGVGFTLILAGTFGGLLLALPKSGAWLNWVKKISAFIFIGIGEYFLIKAGGGLLW